VESIVNLSGPTQRAQDAINPQAQVDASHLK
jgi:hypothetical protein